MQRKFLTNLALLLFLNLLVKPFWLLGIDRSVQNVVGAEDYGFYFIILNFSFLFNILLDLGITSYNNRNIAQNNQLLNKHFSGIVLLRFLLAILYFGITFSVALIWGYTARQLYFLLFLTFNQFLMSFVLYLRSNISGLLLFRTDSILSVLDRMLMIIICGVLLWGNITDQPFRIEWFVYAQTVAYLLTSLIAFLIVVRKAKLKRLNWNRPFFVMIIKKSLPFALLFLLMIFYNRFDTVLIGKLLASPEGNEQAGIYAMAYRLLDASNMIAYLFSVLLLPIFSTLLKKNETVGDMVKLTANLLITFAIIVALVSTFYNHHIMELLYSRHSTETLASYEQRIDQAGVVFGILMWGFVAISTTYIFGTLLTANGSLKRLNIIAACGVLISISLNILLIPVLKATGSAIASLTAQTITALAQVIAAQLLFKFRVNYRYFITLSLFIIVVVVLGFLTTRMIVGWMTGLMIMITGSVLVAFLVRLFNVRDLKAILARKE